jgi:hypothetical protein
VGWGTGWGGEAWTGLILFRIGTGDKLSWTWWWTFGFHKMRGISCIAEDLFISQVGLCSMELVSYVKCCIKIVLIWLYYNTDIEILCIHTFWNSYTC